MEKQKNTFLVVAAALSGIAALLHLACIFFGAPLFRFLGTEAMARMYEAGLYLHPIMVCLFLATVLFIWSAYALSGAGIIRKLPFRKFLLVCITMVYLARGVAFPFLTQHFPENSALFWYCSSLIVFIIGAVHFIGVKKAWQYL